MNSAPNLCLNDYTVLLTDGGGAAQRHFQTEAGSCINEGMTGGGRHEQTKKAHVYEVNMRMLMRFYSIAFGKKL